VRFVVRLIKGEEMMVHRIVCLVAISLIVAAVTNSAAELQKEKTAIEVKRERFQPLGEARQVFLRLIRSIPWIVGVPTISLASDECASEAKMFIMTKKQSGSEIKVKPGDIIQIELQALGSAGYSWYIDQIDAKYLELISENTKHVSEDGKVGIPAVIIWQFKAKKHGSTEIKMDYYRKWEGVGKSVDHFFLKINISEKRG
jgi:predicted secreted protein